MQYDFFVKFRLTERAPIHNIIQMYSDQKWNFIQLTFLMQGPERRAGTQAEACYFQ